VDQFSIDFQRIYFILFYFIILFHTLSVVSIPSKKLIGKIKNKQILVGNDLAWGSN